MLAACAAPSPYERPAPPPPSETPPAETQPGEPPSTVEPPQPLPPVVREPTLGAASRALVTQAQTQMATKNYPVAASSIERALRIEPDNPLLWIELGKIRLADEKDFFAGDLIIESRISELELEGRDRDAKRIG